MTNEELNTELYKKMFDEQERFKEELRNSSPQEIILNAYELVIRDDILLSLEYNDLSDAQVKELLKSDHPLNDIYLKWEITENHHMEEVWDIVESHANELLQDAKAKANRGAR